MTTATHSNTINIKTATISMPTTLSAVLSKTAIATVKREALKNFGGNPKLTLKQDADKTLCLFTNRILHKVRYNPSDKMWNFKDGKPHERSHHIISVTPRQISANFDRPTKDIKVITTSQRIGELNPQVLVTNMYDGSFVGIYDSIKLALSKLTLPASGYYYAKRAADPKSSTISAYSFCWNYTRNV